MNKEFEYNYYFELYKEKSTLCHRKFKNKFKEEHPNANIDLDKMVVEIERYQINKYGRIKYNDNFINFVDVNNAMRKAVCRRYHKYGNKEEREKRQRKQKEGKI